MNYNLLQGNSKTAFRSYAEALQANGFAVVPIWSRKKHPAVEKNIDWRKLNLDQDGIRSYIEKDKSYGVGIVTGEVCAIDIDLYDVQAVSHIVEMVCKELKCSVEDLVIRQGEAPKLMLIFKAQGTFPKLNTGGYVHWGDEIETVHRVETCAEGQQFVMAGVHPTGVSFKCSHDLATLKISDLPVITQDQVKAIIDKSVLVLDDMGFTKQEPKRSDKLAVRSTVSDAIVNRRDEEDELLDIDSTSENFTYETLTAALSSVQFMAEDYDSWVKVGQVLHYVSTHSPDVFDDDTGTAFELFALWSEDAASYEGEEACEKKWESFNTNRAHGSLLTVRSLLKWSRDALKQQMHETVVDIEQRTKSCDSLEELSEVIIPELAKMLAEVGASKLDIDSMAGLVAAQSARISKDRKFSIVNVRKQLTDLIGGNEGVRGMLALPDDRRLSKEEIVKIDGFRWCKNWLYVTGSENYYNSRTHKLLPSKAFNIQHSRFLTPLGSLHCEIAPAQFMANIYEVDSVHGVLVAPDRKRLFDFGGNTYANNYEKPPYEILSRSKWSDAQADFIEKLDAHILTVCGGDKTAAHILCEFLATALLTPERTIQWFVLMIGPEGSGKSLFLYIANLLLGEKFVKKVTSAELTGSRFNDWAEQSLLVNIEELKASGQNRVETQNKLKDLSNPIISVEGKGVKSYSLPNYTSVIANSNFNDPVKIDSGDRRYFIIKSLYRNEVELEEFLRKNPNAFKTIYDGILGPEKNVNRDAIAGYLAEFLATPSREFSRAMREQRAPMTDFKRTMIGVEQDPMVDELHDVIETGRCPFLQPHYMSITELTNLIEVDVFNCAEIRNVTEKNTLARTIGRFLTKAPFYFTEDIRIRIQGQRHTIHFRYPPTIKTKVDKAKFRNDCIEKMAAHKNYLVLNGGRGGLSDDEFNAEGNWDE